MESGADFVHRSTKVRKLGKFGRRALRRVPSLTSAAIRHSVIRRSYTVISLTFLQHDEMCVIEAGPGGSVTPPRRRYWQWVYSIAIS
jgi:hypothetical protein